MKTKIYLRTFLLLTLVLFATGCDPVQDLVDFVDSLFSGFFPSIWCWMMYVISAIFNSVGSFMTLLVLPLFSILPEYTLPAIDLGSVPFLGYAAYFLPISEGATLVKYLLTFYTIWFVGRVILRWLKVLR